MAASVELGFLEKEPNSKLLSKDFPSKVGGKPAWLNLKCLPWTERLTCRKCGRPMVLLLQVYAPVDDVPSCFHRTLYLFICKTADCCERNGADNLLVLRCQLPRSNEFYSYDPPPEPVADEEVAGLSAADFNKLCNVCGCVGLKCCGRCKITNYCSKEHQLIDWRLGHKEICAGKLQTSAVITPDYLLPEAEIVTEPEDYPESEERSEAERMKDYENYVNTTNEESEITNANDLESMATASKDKQYQTFKKRIDHEPEQILRYERNGHPLWVSNENIPHVDQIPDCQCGSRRQFEFQVLPQLLNHLNLDCVGKSIDWGTLAIYTCSQNCVTTDEAYYQEFVWKQDFSEDN